MPDADPYAGWKLEPAAVDTTGWKLEPVKAAGEPTADEPGIVRQALTWANTPFKAMQPIVDEQKRLNTGGLIDKNSSEGAAAVASFLSGVPGFQHNATSPEYDARMQQFNSNHPVAKWLLPLAGGLGKPAALPGASAAAGSSAGGFADLLERAGIKAGRRAISGGGTISVAKPLSDDAVREAINSGAIRFGGTLEGTANRLGALRKQVGGQYGDIISQLEAAGVRGPQAQALSDQYLKEGARSGANTMNAGVPKIYETAAEQVAGKPTVEGFLPLSRGEKLKQSLQDQASSAYKQLAPNEIGQAHEATASMMRQAVEDAIESQRGAAPVLADAFRPVKQRLGNIIEASDLANTAAARASRNRAFSLTDTIAGAGGIAAGEPLTAAAGVLGNKLLRSRGASTTAVMATGGASVIRKLTALATSQPEALGRFALPLARAAERGPDAIAATHFTLSTDPEYQKLAHDAAEGEQ